MDVELARTFLEVMSAGTFLDASKRLNVTQTTITARINSLEEKLDSKLFIRNRSGAKLTSDGERFVEYATSLVQLWDRARAEIRLPQGLDTRLCIGAENSLWNPLMINWVLWIQAHIPNLALHSDVANSDVLLERLEAGGLDAAIIHRPKYHSGLVIEQIMEEKLIHVQSVDSPKPDLFINWSEEFRSQYDSALPQPRQTAYSFNLGPLALQIMLQQGGNGYFRTRVVKQYIERGKLERVPQSPEFTHPVFVVYKKNKMTESLNSALLGLKSQAKKDIQWYL
ncbi:LysR family transcriptional regulator [Litoribacillus peritrichatus]|uniref:LysR family transcriptional regulator n=1 Tax=Litoribacillus peritrichatus TaxID=718191 RepID=A0ABP7MW65_9GAMM